MIKLNKYYKGCYRTESVNNKFGQIKKNNNKWYGEIRHSITGKIIQYAGIWNTRKETLNEIDSLLFN